MYDCAEKCVWVPNQSFWRLAVTLRLLFSFVVFGLSTCLLGTAQAPAGAPAGSTGQCNDGTYTTAPSKKGACRGHQGVKTWFSTTPAGPASTPTNTSAPTAAPTPAPGGSAKTSTQASAKAATPGGGPGLVWLNTSTNVYHCYGTRYYGTTKAGKYLSESDAKAAGAHPDHGKACSQ